MNLVSVGGILIGHFFNPIIWHQQKSPKSIVWIILAKQTLSFSEISRIVNPFSDSAFALFG